MIARFVFVVATARPDETIAYFRDVLDGEVVKTDAAVTLVQVGPGVVEVLTRDHVDPVAPFPQLALEVDDVAAWHRRLLDAGAPVSYGPIELPGGGWSVGSREPNGARISFFSSGAS